MTDCCLCVCLRTATHRRLVDSVYPPPLSSTASVLLRDAPAPPPAGDGGEGGAPPQSRGGTSESALTAGNAQSVAAGAAEGAPRDAAAPAAPAELWKRLRAFREDRRRPQPHLERLCEYARAVPRKLPNIAKHLSAKIRGDMRRARQLVAQQQTTSTTAAAAAAAAEGKAAEAHGQGHGHAEHKVQDALGRGHGDTADAAATDGRRTKKRQRGSSGADSGRHGVVPSVEGGMGKAGRRGGTMDELEAAIAEASSPMQEAIADVFVGLQTLRKLVEVCAPEQTLALIENQVIETLLYCIGDPNADDGASGVSGATTRRRRSSAAQVGMSTDLDAVRREATEVLLVFLNWCDETVDLHVFVKPVLDMCSMPAVPSAVALPGAAGSGMAPSTYAFRLRRALAVSTHETRMLGFEALLKLIEVLMSGNAALLETNMDKIVDVVLSTLREEFDAVMASGAHASSAQVCRPVTLSVPGSAQVSSTGARSASMSPARYRRGSDTGRAIASFEALSATGSMSAGGSRTAPGATHGGAVSEFKDEEDDLSPDAHRPPARRSQGGRHSNDNDYPAAAGLAHHESKDSGSSDAVELAKDSSRNMSFPSTFSQSDIETSSTTSQDAQSMARECLSFIASIASPSTLHRLLASLLHVFDVMGWTPEDFISDVLRLVTSAAESMNAYHFPLFHKLLAHLVTVRIRTQRPQTRFSISLSAAQNKLFSRGGGNNDDSPGVGPTGAGGGPLWDDGPRGAPLGATPGIPVPVSAPGGVDRSGQAHAGDTDAPQLSNGEALSVANGGGAVRPRSVSNTSISDGLPPGEDIGGGVLVYRLPDRNLAEYFAVLARILRVTTTLVYHHETDVPVNTLLEEDMSHLFRQIALCAAHGSSSPLNEYEEVGMLLSSAMECLQGLAERLPSSIERANILVFIARLTLDSSFSQFSALVQSVQRRNKFFQHLLQAMYIVLSRSPVVFHESGASSTVPDTVIAQLARLVLVGDATTCGSATVTLDTLLAIHSDRTRQQGNRRGSMISIPYPDTLKPFTARQLDLVRDVIFQVVSQWEGADQAQRVWHVSRLLNRMLRKFGVVDMEGSLPVIFALEEFSVAFPLQEMEGAELECSLELVCMCKSVIVSYLRTLARMLRCADLGAYIAELQADWEARGVCAWGLPFMQDSPDLERRRSTEPAASRVSRMHASPADVVAQELPKALPLHRQRLQAALMATSALGSAADDVRRACDHEYEPRVDTAEDLQQVHELGDSDEPFGRSLTSLSTDGVEQSSRWSNYQQRRKRRKQRKHDQQLQQEQLQRYRQRQQEQREQREQREQTETVSVTSVGANEQSTCEAGVAGGDGNGWSSLHNTQLQLEVDGSATSNATGAAGAAAAAGGGGPHASVAPASPSRDIIIHQRDEVLLGDDSPTSSPQIELRGRGARHGPQNGKVAEDDAVDAEAAMGQRGRQQTTSKPGKSSAGKKKRRTRKGASGNPGSTSGGARKASGSAESNRRSRRMSAEVQRANDLDDVLDYLENAELPAIPDTLTQSAHTRRQGSSIPTL